PLAVREVVRYDDAHGLWQSPAPGRGNAGAVCPDGLHPDPDDRDACRHDLTPVRRGPGIAAAWAGHLAHRPSRTTGCSRRLTASATLRLPGAAEPQRSADQM